MNSFYKISSEIKWIPEGFHFLGPESGKTRRKLLNKIQIFFEENHFQEVFPPTFDYTTSFHHHISQMDKWKLLKSRDLFGDEISPSIDLTLQVVKGMAGYLEKNQNHNIFYTGRVIKDNSKSGDRREFLQIGAEIIGSSDKNTAIKIFSLINDLCGQLNIHQKITIVIGHIHVFNEIIRHLQLNETDRLIFSKLVYSKDKTNLKEFLQQKSASSEIVQLILDLLFTFEIRVVKEKISNISSKFNFDYKNELLEIESIFSELDTLKNVDFCLDLSLIPDLDYYTGIVFHGYSKDLFYPIFMGGSYNHLYEKFTNVKKTASGFAINIDLLEEIYNTH